MATIIDRKEEIGLSGKQHSELFVCPYDGCGRMFKAQFSMNRHLVVHSQVKSHKCRYCGKGFTLPQYLREHEYTHTKELPYVCGVSGCVRRFRQAGKLSLHRRTHPEYITKKYNYTLNQQKRTKKQVRSAGSSKKGEAGNVQNRGNMSTGNAEKEVKGRLPSMKYVKTYLDHSAYMASSLTVVHDHVAPDLQNGKGANCPQIEIEEKEIDLLAKFLDKVYSTSASPASYKGNSPRMRSNSGLDLFDLIKKYGEGNGK
eukprot:TRINITY_DN3625_c0_g4_i3.p1 TRINITY_DN3625_c0_g4~~TRINITY_DN3625_c0_g4_i3.p1  ORF type:complete len:257 (-),score=47.60 TRINITY_DN3625_c0_g4_i3:269-1039(-)